MKFKWRWVWKSMSYRATSSVIGAIVVWFLTGSWISSGLYALFYTPIALFWFMCHEKLWYMQKMKNRCNKCVGRGVYCEVLYPSGNKEAMRAVFCDRCGGSGRKR